MTDGTRTAQRPPARRRGVPRPPEPLAGTAPVARVLVDVPLPHLDRPYDYAVTERQSAVAVPGARVRVRFAGRLVDGFVLERDACSAHDGRLTRLSRVLSAEPVLSADVARLARLVADRYAGTVADVLRLAVPPRHARVEREEPPEPAAPPDRPTSGPWAVPEGGMAFLDALAAGGAPRAVWQALPGAGSPAGDWPDALARAAVTATAGGRGAIVVLPDVRDVARVDAALRTLLGPEPGQHVVLTADLGPAERYRRWLAVRRGRVRLVVGTRAAAFAPVANLGLVACWDDGDDLLAEPRAPYPHAREVLLLRAHDTGCGVLLSGHARTAEAQQLVTLGWAGSLEAPRAVVREATPRVRAAGDDAELARDAAARAARLPSLAWRIARDALQNGPVLVQVPRSGYVPGLACRECRRAAACTACGGPLALPARQDRPSCRWCGTVAGAWVCPACDGRTLCSTAVGHRRTAEELSRAFPGVPAHTSAGDGVLDVVGAEPAIVVATPGAEPPADGGYAAALLLDGGTLLQRTALRAAEETLRRWLAAAALVRPGEAGGVVVVMAPSASPVVQALLRWDPVGAATRELADRRALRFPPVARLAEITAAAPDLDDALAELALPRGATVLGPVPVDADGERCRALVRCARSQGAVLGRALRDVQARRSAHRHGSAVRIRVDPVDLA